jgi:methylated-DNA-[protein]-cysteine S-methyltransferase
MMCVTDRPFALFETPIGTCALAWSPRGITAVQLPERDARETRARMLRRFPPAREAPPPHEARLAIDAICGLLHGAAVDLSFITLDMDGVPGFHQRVYDVTRRIPPGRTLTYGEIAARLGSPGSARAVGGALGRNPFAIVVPCHRVIAAGGSMGGFSANGGVATKLRLLAIEGAGRPHSPSLFGSVT